MFHFKYTKPGRDELTFIHVYTFDRAQLKGKDLVIKNLWLLLLSALNRKDDVWSWLVLFISFHARKLLYVYQDWQEV